MGLKEKAKSIYLDWRREEEKKRQERLQKFANEIRTEFSKRFGVEPDLVCCQTPITAEVLCDGIRFKVFKFEETIIYGIKPLSFRPFILKRKKSHLSFRVQTKRREKEIRNLVDLGKAIVEEGLA